MINAISSMPSSAIPHNDTLSSNEGFGNYINNVSNSSLEGVMPNYIPEKNIASACLFGGPIEKAIENFFHRLINVFSYSPIEDIER